MIRQYDVILFDMNGVLVDDEPLHFLAFQEILAAMGYSLTKETYEAHCLGTTDEYGFRAIVPAILGVDAGDDGIARAVREKAACYQRLLNGAIPWMPGGRELIHALRDKGYRLALATGAVRSEAEMVIAGLGAEGIFETVLTGEEIRRSKPDPEPYLTTAERLKVAPERCLVIEDSIPGVRSAKAAGMTCVALTSSHSAEALAQAGADMVVDSLRELIAHVSL